MMVLKFHCTLYFIESMVIIIFNINESWNNVEMKKREMAGDESEWIVNKNHHITCSKCPPQNRQVLCSSKSLCIQLSAGWKQN